MDCVLHKHECPACDRSFACNRTECYRLAYRLCGECRDKQREIRNPVQGPNSK